jgi:peptidoglycan-N-acetylglucosamine deacetylase
MIAFVLAVAVGFGAHAQAAAHSASSTSAGDAVRGPSRIWAVPVERKEIALTFDDGPYPFFTPVLLHELDAEHAHATFFVVCRSVEEFPELLDRIVASGDEVGDHTFNHYVLTDLSGRQIADQIGSCGDLLERYTGVQTTLFRPPHGRYDERVLDIARRLGYRTILWSDAADDSPEEGDTPAPLIVTRILAHAHPGGIVLLHNGRYGTIEALPRIIAALRTEGYSFVTVGQLLLDGTDPKR